MSIINLEQIRAARALGEVQDILQKRQKEGGGDQVSGYHSLIITNGLLCTLAYSADKDGEHRLIAEALMRHIASLQQQGLLPGTPISPGKGLLTVIGELAESNDNTLLSIITQEALAYLNYLKRFIRADKTKQPPNA